MFTLFPKSPKMVERPGLHCHYCKETVRTHDLFGRPKDLGKCHCTCHWWTPAMAR